MVGCFTDSSKILAKETCQINKWTFITNSEFKSVYSPSWYEFISSCNRNFIHKSVCIFLSADFLVFNVCMCACTGICCHFRRRWMSAGFIWNRRKESNWFLGLRYQILNISNMLPNFFNLHFLPLSRPFRLFLSFLGLTWNILAKPIFIALMTVHSPHTGIILHHLPISLVQRKTFDYFWLGTVNQDGK